MTAPDTSAEAVGRLAAFHALRQKGYDADEERGLRACAAMTAAMLRALLKERDAALTDARDFERQSEIAYAERDAAREALQRIDEHGWGHHNATAAADLFQQIARVTLEALARGGEGG